MEYSALVQHISNKIKQEIDSLKVNWRNSEPVSHFLIDDLLPEDFALEVAKGFPPIEKMNRYNSIRERKASSANRTIWGQATRDAFLALQDPTVMELFSEITDIQDLYGDPSAYAGGISMMVQGDFLNPHLDNSTHPSLKGYRRLNALLYISPDWSLEFGGNLELWGPKLKNRKEVASLFNRLVVMNTNRHSLHSVNRVCNPAAPRLCVSNYYFTQESPHKIFYSHVTSFRGRPGENLKDYYLRAEGKLASMVQTWLGKPLR